MCINSPVLLFARRVRVLLIVTLVASVFGSVLAASQASAYGGSENFCGSTLLGKAQICTSAVGKSTEYIFNIAGENTTNGNAVCVAPVTWNGKEYSAPYGYSCGGADYDWEFTPIASVAAAVENPNGVSERIGGLFDWKEYPPVATTESASGIQPSQATLNGTLNPERSQAHYYFEYGKTTSYGSSTSEQSAGSGTSNEKESATISGLEEGATYHYRLVVKNAVGTTYGGDQSFTTLSKPEASTTAASEIKPLQAQLNGSVNPKGTSTKYYFKYGKTTSYGSTTSEGNAGSGQGTVGENATVAPEPGTTYHYRIVARSEGGTAEGGDQEFKTPGPVEAVTSAPSGVMEEQATLNGTVNPKGYDAKYYFQYGETTSYGSVTSEGDAGAGTSPLPESATLSKLPSETTYHYRLVGTSGGVTSYGADQAVRTLAREVNGDPVVIKYKPGEVDLYWRGSKGELNGDWTGSKGWEGPTQLPVNGEGGVAGKLAVIQPSQGEVDIYWRASNGSIYGDWTTGTSWKGPTALPMSKECTAAGDPSALQYSPSEVDVYWRGSKGQICGDWTGSGTWHGPTELPNKECTAAGNPAVSHPSLTEVDVYWRGSKGQICGDWTGSKGWEGPTQLPVNEGGAAGDPAVIHPSSSTVDLYWRGSNNKIYGDWASSGTWHGPTALPVNEGGAAGDPVAIQLSSSELDVYWLASNSTVYGDWSSSGTWKGPVQLP